MKKFQKETVFLALLLNFLHLSCATSPTGRRQLIVVSDSQMSTMGAQAFTELKKTEVGDASPSMTRFIDCIVSPLTREAAPQTTVTSWEVNVFKKDEANAFALPGGKIGVYTGLLKVARSNDQLAAVIGHEIGHVIAKHGAERVSQQAGTQLGLSALGAITSDNPKKGALMSLLGVGLQVGVLLPFSRAQESEADVIGLQLMAKAGFDPRESTELWRNMIASTGGSSTPQWMSTHPASEARITVLESHMDQALSYYNQAIAAGRKPVCIRPALR